jgi:hypothetical protein
VGANFSEFNGACAFRGRRRFRRQRGVCGDFVNLEDLPTRSSKMLLGVGFRACIHRDECTYVVSVSDVLCKSQKRKKELPNFTWRINLVFCQLVKNICQVKKEHISLQQTGTIHLTDPDLTYVRNPERNKKNCVYALTPLENSHRGNAYRRKTTVRARVYIIYM